MYLSPHWTTASGGFLGYKSQGNSVIDAPEHKLRARQSLRPHPCSASSPSPSGHSNSLMFFPEEHSPHMPPNPCLRLCFLETPPKTASHHTGLLKSGGSQSRDPRPAASVSQGHLLETHILRAHLLTRPTDSEPLGWGSALCALASPPGHSSQPKSRNTVGLRPTSSSTDGVFEALGGNHNAFDSKPPHGF